MNYAAIGYVIGHEITHGFDDLGSQFDYQANIGDWWEKEAKIAYLERTRCIIEQYGNFVDVATGLHLNGINTQGENIADNGGIRSAYYAYQQWTKLNGPEEPLPGLANYTANQMFWISVGQTWCSVNTPQEMVIRIHTAAHSPSEFRVNGPLSNMEEFASDWNCRVDAEMNPTKKCRVW